MKEEVTTAAALDLRTGLLQVADGPKLLPCPSYALRETAERIA